MKRFKDKYEYAFYVDDVIHSSLATFQNRVMITSVNCHGKLESFYFTMPDEIRFEKEFMKDFKIFLYDYLIKRNENKKKEENV